MQPIEHALARRQLAVQSMNSQAFRRFDWRRPSVKLVTMHSAKGLEFPLVFVAGLQALPMRDEAIDDAARLLYVAMTRATHELVLSTHGRSPIVERVTGSLAEVGRRFAKGAA
jgi:superfamily I DNA/RNA helicase